jgi:hypothetical protein
MNDKELCREAASVYPGILAAWIIKDGEVSSYFFKPKVPMQNPAKVNEMVMQANILGVIGASNEDFFGEFGYLMFHWKHADVFIFPTEVDTPKLLVIRVVRPYDHEEIVQKITDFMMEKRIRTDRVQQEPGI